MRKFVLLAALFSPLALADAISVAAHSVLRLPNKASVVHLQRLEVADSATLVLPASLVELKVDELHLGNQARIAIVPAEHALSMEVAQAQLGQGSEIAAHGAPGTYERVARPGRDLSLRIQALENLRFNFAYDKTTDKSNSKGGHRLTPSLLTKETPPDNVFDSNTSMPADNKVMTKVMTHEVLLMIQVMH